MGHTARTIWLILGTYAILGWLWVWLQGVDPHEVAQFRSHPGLLSASDLVIRKGDIEDLDRRERLLIVSTLSLEDARIMGLCVLKDDQTYVVQDADGERYWMPAPRAVTKMPECFLESDFEHSF